MNIPRKQCPGCAMTHRVWTGDGTPITMKYSERTHRTQVSRQWLRQKQAVCQVVNAAILIRNEAHVVSVDGEQVTMNLDTWALFSTAINEFMDTIYNEELDAWITRW